MKLKAQRSGEQDADDEAQQENSINSNQTNFISKFKDSYNINQSLNSLTKPDDVDKPHKPQFPGRKSTISKTSIKKDQSKDVTTMDASAINLKPTPHDFHKSLGKLSGSISKGLDWPLNPVAEQHKSLHKDQPENSLAKRQGNLNMSLNYHFKPRLGDAKHLFDPRRQKLNLSSLGCGKQYTLRNVTNNSSVSNSMIISDSSKNPIPSCSCVKK